MGHVISIGHSIYTVSVSDYGPPERLLRAPDSMAVALLFSGFLVACGRFLDHSQFNLCQLSYLAVQGFFAARIYRLSHAWFMPCLCGVLSFLRLLGCTFLFVCPIRMTSTMGWETQWSWLLKSIWAVSSSNDIILAVALTHALWKQRALSESRRTIALVDKVMKWTLGKQKLSKSRCIIELRLIAIFSVTGLVVLITIVTMKNKYIWVAWYLVTAKLYSNALFATLNSRATLRTMDASEIILNTAVRHRVILSLASSCPPCAFAPYASSSPSPTFDTAVNFQGCRHDCAHAVAVLRPKLESRQTASHCYELLRSLCLALGKCSTRAVVKQTPLVQHRCEAHDGFVGRRHVLLALAAVPRRAELERASMTEMEAQGRTASSGPKYRASNPLAERAAWDFAKMAKGDVGWDVSTYGSATRCARSTALGLPDLFASDSIFCCLWCCTHNP
ncbi:hypothetical protein FB451DRAFT_1433435 [Mycena latifolia]|nr:hypothetical protein FB451DRAFT_1433435 [Mycena latifolia]